MYCSLHSCKSPAGVRDGLVASWCQSSQSLPICAALDPPQTFPASQNPQENKENDQSEYPTVLLLWSPISPVFPPPKS